MWVADVAIDDGTYIFLDRPARVSVPSHSPAMAHSAYFPPQSAVEQIKRHPKYYLNGGDVHFLVSLRLLVHPQPLSRAMSCMIGVAVVLCSCIGRYGSTVFYSRVVARSRRELANMLPLVLLVADTSCAG